VPITGCRDTIPDVNIIADYIETAMDSIKGGIYLRDLMQKQKSEQ
tara:strand:- start:1579 stop:1713 length:135 start_codon:yes stop_codon:yes gene_type:complete